MLTDEVNADGHLFVGMSDLELGWSVMTKVCGNFTGAIQELTLLHW